MENDGSLRRLAVSVALGKITQKEIGAHGFKLKPGKIFLDVLKARNLKSEQRTGGLDEMIYHIMENLKLTVNKI